MARKKGDKQDPNKPYKKPNLPPDIKRETGRPPIYHEGLDENVRRLCLLGLSDQEIAEYLGINDKTMWQWDNDHPSFCNARKEGRVKADARVAAALYDRAIGMTYKEQQIVRLKKNRDEEEAKIMEVDKVIIPDTHAAALWLSNRQRGRWSIKPIVAGEGGDSDANTIKIVGGLPDE